MKNKLAFSIILVILFVFNVNAQKSNTQHLLNLQDQMANAKNSAAKRNLLKEAYSIPGFPSFMFISKSLNDEAVSKDAAILLARLAVNDKNTKGPAVRAVLVNALPLITGKENAVLVSKITQQLIGFYHEDGFVNLFNGKV